MKFLIDGFEVEQGDILQRSDWPKWKKVEVGPIWEERGVFLYREGSGIAFQFFKMQGSHWKFYEEQNDKDRIEELETLLSDIKTWMVDFPHTPFVERIQKTLNQKTQP